MSPDIDDTAEKAAAQTHEKIARGVFGGHFDRLRKSWTEMHDPNNSAGNEALADFNREWAEWNKEQKEAIRSRAEQKAANIMATPEFATTTSTRDLLRVLESQGLISPEAARFAGDRTLGKGQLYKGDQFRGERPDAYGFRNMVAIPGMSPDVLFMTQNEDGSRSPRDLRELAVDLAAVFSVLESSPNVKSVSEPDAAYFNDRLVRRAKPEDALSVTEPEKVGKALAELGAAKLIIRDLVTEQLVKILSGGNESNQPKSLDMIRTNPSLINVLFQATDIPDYLSHGLYPEMMDLSSVKTGGHLNLAGVLAETTFNQKNDAGT